MNAPSSSYPAFPLTDERPPEERPPWEPRSRLEMEREIADLRATNKKLGDSIGWIVDALLQDESEPKDPRELRSIRLRKREALESLSYVREVLVGNASKVDDTLLIGEEEMKARRSREKRMDPPPLAEVSKPVTVPVHESRPKPANSSHVISYSPDSSPRARLTRTPSPATRAPSHNPPRRALSPPLRLPPNTSTNTNPNLNASIRFAPWNYTRSSFSEGSTLPVTTLPRLPPPASVFRPAPIPSVSARPLPPDRTVDALSHDQPQNDPLGVLPF
jgi:TBC1 domain family protein 5